MKTFRGYRRPNGTVGTRNHIAVLPTVNCVNDTAYQMCQQVPGTIPLLSSLSCTHFSGDKEKAERAMKGILKNPNIYAAVIIGVGDCEPCSADALAKTVIEETGKQVLPLSFKNSSDFDSFMMRGVEFLNARSAEIQEIKRTDCPLSDLTVITKCGGSGAVSVLSNNAAVGRAVDLLTDEGGTAIFSETAELLGVEKTMAARCATPALQKNLLGIVERLKAEIDRYGVDIMGSEPVPANVKNGLSTIEEKSLGSVAKSGTREIIGVLEYADFPDNGSGLYFMDCDSSGEAVYSGGMAAGAQVGVFSLSGGIPGRLRSMAASGSGLQALPTVKVLGSNNPPDLSQYFDICTEEILEGTKSIEEAGEELLETIIKVASGEKTYTENYCRYFAPINYFRSGLLL